MNSPLPPDPYKTLGVAKDAKLPEIRSAHRKLVLKCHPDKVQDAALKAVKQDEFQKVQQAYELLSDDTKRQQYDDQVKLFELRKEMGRGNPTPRSNPFEYEVKTAEPRANSYARAAPKVYTYPAGVPRSHEDLYDEREPMRHTPKKSSSYESATDRDRKRPSARDEERIREMQREAAIRKLQEEEDRMRAAERARAEDRIRSEKARDKDRRDRSHKEKTKSREKERKSRGEEKGRKTYVEDDSSDDEVYRARAAEKKARRMEEEMQRREAEAAAMRAEAERVHHVRAEEARAAKVQAQRAQIKEAPMDPKWRDHADFAGAYMQAARRKVAVDAEDDRHHPHPGMRRTETFSGQPSPAYNVRYATIPPQPQYSDDDTARRSSGYKDPRRSSDTPPSSKREKSRRRSPEHTTGDPYINIVEPPSPSTAGTPKKPSLQSYSSAPPTLSQTRKEPSRSRTTDNYTAPRKDTVPPLPRSQTFTNDGRDPGRGRERGGSRLRKEYTETESDSDNSPTYQARPSHSPRRAPEPTVYRVAEGRAHPTTSRSHRSDLHNLNEPSYARERSTSPRGTPSRHERPPITRNPPSGEYRTSPTSNYYTAPEPPPVKPVIVTARPKLPREGSGSSRSHRHQAPAASYEQVKYAPTYDTSNVSYASYPGANLYDTARRPSDQRDYYGPPHRGRDPVYA
ncbi:uncharacterized protein PAC_18346 [Phialocephala subalpina]|uniref:J domain-containing protein n=1 Tax=Phialocephala subalpina TaxID=576137 RepID=A0A1L7XU02_9HELO|nr:uncharacterized protein PAC_18346 [Phialocephala subalpina]